MASPGQRRGICGHMMAGFDQHERCARCRDKGLGSDPCVQKKVCVICDTLSDQQRDMLSTPQYQIRKDKKAGLLVSPSKVTVVGVVDQDLSHLPQDVPDPSGSGPQESFRTILKPVISSSTSLLLLPRWTHPVRVVLSSLVRLFLPVLLFCLLLNLVLLSPLVPLVPVPVRLQKQFQRTLTLNL